MVFRAATGNSMQDVDTLLGQKIDKLDERMESFEKAIQPIIQITPKLQEIVEAYDSVLFGKKFLAGLATIIGSIVAIGGAVIWLFDYIRHG